MSDPRVTPPESTHRAALDRAQGEIQVKTNVIMELGQALRQRDQALAVANEQLRVSKAANELVSKQRGDAVSLLHMVMRDYGYGLRQADHRLIRTFLDSL